MRLTRGWDATVSSTIRSGRIARLTDACPIACTGSTSLHCPPPRRRTPPGATYKLKGSVQRSGATSTFSNYRIGPFFISIRFSSLDVSAQWMCKGGRDRCGPHVRDYK